jgi:lipopolysaccharide/colanic/teichoic acid biosynthesis glycosyltransferase
MNAIISRLIASNSLTEVQFIAALSHERRRAERSKKPFVLMLADLHKLASLLPADGWMDRIIGSLLDSVRATDVVGWYHDGQVLGVIFTELGKADKDTALAALKARMTNVIQGVPGVAHSITVKLSFHWFPERLAAPMGSVDLAVYPEIQRSTKGKKIAYGVKRFMDIAGCALILASFSWLLLAIAIVIKATSRGPALFHQARIGLHGKPFTFLKFRSMRVNNDATIHKEYVTRFISGDTRLSPGEQEVFKITNDPRVTWFGRILRRTSLDELPQLFNVLKGEMSLIGPRPALPYEFECYDLWHRRRVLEVKPGITGLWQVSGRSRTSFDEMVRLDLQYARNWSLWLDVKILFRTPGAVLSGDGAY